MKDLSLFYKVGNELCRPVWFRETVDLLNEDEKKEYSTYMEVYLKTSAEREELLNLIKLTAAKIVFNAVAHDVEEQVIKLQPKAIRNSTEYKMWRDAVLQRDNYTCQKCGKSGCKLNAHHIKPFAQYPKLRLDVSNGITLCKECHIAAHKKAV